MNLEVMRDIFSFVKFLIPLPHQSWTILGEMKIF